MTLLESIGYICIIIFCLSFIREVFINDIALKYKDKGHTCTIILYKSGRMVREDFFNCPVCHEKIKTQIESIRRISKINLDK